VKEVRFDDDAALPTQVICHSFNAANCGHVFCSFLALMLQ